jgi:hypothetical protein
MALVVPVAVREAVKATVAVKVAVVDHVAANAPKTAAKCCRDSQDSCATGDGKFK